MTTPSPLVQITDISKKFGATQALAGVTFDVMPGETLGLLGANGAGKSTLIKILAGIQTPTSGTIRVAGEPADLSSASVARTAGIVTVHQNIDDGVVSGLTVAENLVLDDLGLRGSRSLVTRRSQRRAAQALLDKVGMRLPLDRIVEDLPASGRQEVSIARALAKNPKLLILDEPTSTLSAAESERLFESVEEFKRRGISVLYVSHHMAEIEALCDRAIVLRNGRVVSNHTAPLDLKQITNSILGEAVEINHDREMLIGSEPALVAEGVRAYPTSPPIRLDVRRGEVLGLTGLVGAGKTELLEQLAGGRTLESGTLLLNGENYRPRNFTDAIRQGVVMMPEERAMQAIFPGETVAKHCSVARMGEISTGGFVSKRKERAFAKQIIAEFGVKTAGPDAEIESLSGGNQQKALVGRWLAEKHNVVILDEPFRGVDVGARAVIARQVRNYAKHSAVVVACSDPEELLEIADRILVLVEGHIALEAPRTSIDTDQLAAVMSEFIPATAGNPAA